LSAFALVAVGGLGMSALPARAQVGARTLEGRVLERGTDTPITRAVVTVGETLRATTNERGEFTIRNVPPGRHALVVEALGYRAAHTIVTIDGSMDITGRIELEPDPIALDSVNVTTRFGSIRGRVVDRQTGERIPYILVRVGDADATTTTDAGTFRMGDIPRGQYIVRVEGFGWLPRSFEIEVADGEFVELEIEKDPITQVNIEAAIARLEDRGRSVGFAMTTTDRATIMKSRAPTTIDFLKARGLRIEHCRGMSDQLCIRGRPAVVYIDESPVCLEFFQTYPIEAFERFEFTGASGTTIRAYTRWFVERMTRGNIALKPLTPYGSSFRC
jgi:hypothetical protein